MIAPTKRPACEGEDDDDDGSQEPDANCQGRDREVAGEDPSTASTPARFASSSSASPHGTLGRWELWEVTWTPVNAAVLRINGVVHSMTTPPTALDNPPLTMTLVNGDSADIGYAVVFASDLSASNPSGMTTLRNALVSQFRIF